MFLRKDKINLLLDSPRTKERGLKIRNERDDITSDATKIQRVIRHDYEQFICQQFGEPRRNELIPKTHNLPRMKYEEIGNMHRLTVSYEMESVAKNLPTYKSPGPDSCTRSSLPKI